MPYFCRDFFNDDAEIWDAVYFRCAHCKIDWISIILLRATCSDCDKCGRTIRKKDKRQF